MPLNTEGQWTGATPFNIADPTLHDTAGNSFVDPRGLFVLHAVLLRTGKVLCFGGHVEMMNYAPLCYVFDPDNAGAQMTAITFAAGADPFCSHYVTIPDGRVLAVGGSQHDIGTLDNTLPNPVRDSPGYHYRGSTGEKTIALFDPTTETWAGSRTGGVPNPLRQGRWYPTAVLLPDGRVAVFSGRRELEDAPRPPATFLQFPPGVPAHGIADMVEILGPPDWASTELTGGTQTLPIYPGLHLAPNGRIYYSHTNWGQQIPEPNTMSLLIASGATSGTWTDHGAVPATSSSRREEGMSVLLPLMLPSHAGRILVIGGSKALNIGGVGVLEAGGGGTGAFHHIENAADPLAADILDTSTNTWSAVGPMNFGRINGHCVLLPDATVLICGGHDNYKWQDAAQTEYPAPVMGTTPSLFAEIFTPTAGGGSFRTVPVAERGDAGRFMHAPRMYHSVALLLPDGRVFVAGGADPNSPHEPRPPYPPTWNDREIGSTAVFNRKDYEFFEPPYMHNGPRPVITAVQRNGANTARIEYGQEFNVLTPQASSIAKVAIMRPGAPTHHTDSEQRYVELGITATGSGQITVTAVSDPKIAPPGYYMLWIVDNNAPPRPCAKALFIQLVPRGTTCFVATAALGSPYHPSVVYLQSLRQELREATRAGLHFIRTVNRVYESLSPWLARKVSDDAATREAVREWVVGPAVAAVGAADRLSRHIRLRGLRHAVLMTMLTVEALVVVSALPALATAVLVRIGLTKWLGRRAARKQEE